MDNQQQEAIDSATIEHMEQLYTASISGNKAILRRSLLGVLRLTVNELVEKLNTEDQDTLDSFAWLAQAGADYITELKEFTTILEMCEARILYAFEQNELLD